MAVNDEYMGLLEPKPRYEGNWLGRIRVLGKKTNRQWQSLSDQEIETEIGATQQVFLTYLKEDWLKEFGLLVKFKIQENKRDSDDEGHDIYIVQKSPLLPIKQIGAFLFPYEGEIHRDSIIPVLDGLKMRFNHVNWNYALKFYLWKEDGERSQLIGPFENKPLNNGIQMPKYVHSFSALPIENAIVPYNDQDYLLKEPDTSDASLIDLETNEKRATWFRNKIKKLANKSDFIKKLDQLGPSWRDDFKDVIGDHKKNAISLDQVRWADVQKVLDHVAFEHGELMKLRNTPVFKSFVEQAIEKEKEDLLKPALAAFNTEKAQLEKQIAKLTEKQKKLKVDVSKRTKDKDRLETDIATIQERYGKSQDQLFQDFQTYRKLFERIEGQVSPLIPQAPPNQSSSQRLHDLGDLPNLIEDSQAFITHRLTPLAQMWDGRISEKHAMHLHLALLACKMVMLPCAALIRAYHEALGAASVYRVVTVKPTWLSFDEAWLDGIENTWQIANSNPDRLVFLYLQDVNRALVEIWLRPIMDLASGIRESLPDIPGPWPENLRLVFTETEDKGGLRITPFALAHFARVKLPDQEAAKTSEEKPGNVLADTWRAWASNTSTAVLDSADMAHIPFEVRRMALADWRHLAGLASLHDIKQAPEDLANRLRLKHVPAAL